MACERQRLDLAPVLLGRHPDRLHLGRQPRHVAAADRSDAAVGRRVEQAKQLARDPAQGIEPAGLAAPASFRGSRFRPASGRHAACEPACDPARPDAGQDRQPEAQRRQPVHIDGGSRRSRQDRRPLRAVRAGAVRNADDATKLSEHAYTPEHGGIELSAAGKLLASATALTRIVRYDLTVIDTKLRRSRRRFYLLARGLHFHFLFGTSMARSPLSAYSKSKTHPFTEMVKVSPETFTWRGRTTTAPTTPPPPSRARLPPATICGRSWPRTPSLAGALHVLPQFEVAA